MGWVQNIETRPMRTHCGAYFCYQASVVDFFIAIVSKSIADLNLTPRIAHDLSICDISVDTSPRCHTSSLLYQQTTQNPSRLLDSICNFWMSWTLWYFHLDGNTVPSAKIKTKVAVFNSMNQNSAVVLYSQSNLQRAKSLRAARVQRSEWPETRPPLGV